jgi:SAM-dependent methyltransferase
LWCGPFLAVAGAKPSREIIGADNSASMLEVASKAQPADVVKRVRRLQTSAFEIDLPDNAVDSIFCMRLLHHIGDASHRMALLREFHRVSRDSVIISLWVDGNFKAWKRKRLEHRRVQRLSRIRLPKSFCVTCCYSGGGIQEGRFHRSGASGLYSALRDVAGLRITQEITHDR